MNRSMESSIIQTKIFQRLRNVKQLGLAHYVYPGADFSRFSHSLGVCHVTGRILDELNGKKYIDLKPEEIQKYRLAGLFHDIGHYPYSHAMEDAIGNFSKKSLFERKDSSSTSKAEEPQIKPFYSHEALGKRILELDPEIQVLLKKNGFDSKEISSIFQREGAHPFQNLISSDLDADRIDFLMRTACHTGLPFGNVDIDYLITQMRVDKNLKLCLPRKAIKAADHFLLCRHFDRLQVAYHKTVVALELVLKDVIEALLDRGIINCSREELKKKLSNQDWSDFDDHYILNKIRKLKRSSIEDVLELKVDSILERKPPKLVGISEYFVEREDKTIKNPITGFGSHMLVSEHDKQNPKDQDKIEQAIKILNDDGSNSRPITEVKSSLMSVLAMKTFTSIRFYILFRKDEIGKHPDIQSYLKTELPAFNQEP